MIKKLTTQVQENPLSLALFALLLGGAFIGTSPIFVRLSEVGPVASAFWRVLLVLPLFYLTLNYKVKSRAENKKIEASPQIFLDKKLRYGLILAGFLFAADLAFWHWALQYTTVANATLLSNLMPIIVAIGAHYFFNEKLTARFYLGLVLALSGAVLLAGGSHREGHLFGDMLGVITALFYGLYILSVRWLRRGIGTSAIMFWTGVVSVAFLLPLAWIMGEQILPTTMNGWLILMALGFLSQFLGQGLITFSLAHLPSAFGAVSLLIQPIVAAALAWPIFGEALEGSDLLAAMVILTGIVLARLGAVPKNKTAV